MDSHENNFHKKITLSLSLSLTTPIIILKNTNGMIIVYRHKAVVLASIQCLLIPIFEFSWYNHTSVSRKRARNMSLAMWSHPEGECQM